MGNSLENGPLTRVLKRDFSRAGVPAREKLPLCLCHVKVTDFKNERSFIYYHKPFSCQEFRYARWDIVIQAGDNLDYPYSTTDRPELWDSLVMIGVQTRESLSRGVAGEGSYYQVEMNYASPQDISDLYIPITLP